MAQSTRLGNDNMQVRNSQSIANGNAIDGVIESVTVYPNPVVDVLKVSFRSSRKSMAVISLFNNIGKEVYSQESEVIQGNNIVSIDIRSKAIESGIYFVQCLVENEICTRKLIVK